VVTAGDVVGNYLLGRELGRGGMGRVYAATHRVLGHEAAIKVLLPELTAMREQMERFFNEARATRAIAHPGLVEILDVGVDAGRAYIAMELLAGESLGARLRRGRLPVRTAVELARAIADPLAAAHAQAIVHRDLKPDNVFLCTDGTVKLLDFGVAKLLGDDAPRVRTVTGAMVGTVHYMSPEQCAGSPRVDHRADLYALGCVLHHMLVGRVPFEADSALVVAGMHQESVPPDVRALRPEVSAELAAVLGRLLAKTPDDRFASARAVIDALGAPGIVALGGAGVATADAPALVDALAPTTAPSSPAIADAPVPVDDRPTHRPSPRRWPWLVAAFAVAGAVVGVVALARRGGDPRAPAVAHDAVPVVYSPNDARRADATPVVDATISILGVTEAEYRDQVATLRQKANCADLEAYLARFPTAWMRGRAGFVANHDLLSCEHHHGWGTPKKGLLNGDPELLIDRIPDTDLLHVCAERTFGNPLDALTAVPCGLVACRTGHVYWARYFTILVEPGPERARVAAECAKRSLPLDL
jgi:eukaryotic-like serine/threonine-protein kinase